MRINLNNDIKLCIDVNSFRNKLRGVLLDNLRGRNDILMICNCNFK